MLITVFVLGALCLSCTKQEPEKPLYSFFSAGHTYGNPSDSEPGFHPPFANYINEINSDSMIKLGFLTGDVVYRSKPEYWETTLKQISTFNIPIHIAAGNHDIGPEFERRFSQYYYNFIFKNDLFIILTPGLDKWNITNDQFSFLKQSLDENHSTVNNIFIFLHELIWWSPDNKYKDVKINYQPHYPGSNNYKNIVEPLLHSYENDITLLAGDLGASSGVSSIMYDKVKNLTLIASGMGDGERDNIIITSVYPDRISHEVQYIGSKYNFKRVDITKAH